MRRQRRNIAIVLTGLFLSYFSASFIFVPQAPGLKDRDTTITKLESNDDTLTHGVLRSASSEHAEDALNFFDDKTISILEYVHSAEQEQRLSSNGDFQQTSHSYLSLRKLQI